MKSLRKIGRAHRLKTHDQIKAWLQPKLGSIGTKYRLAARIRLANAWARKHPKRTCACVVGTLSFLLAVTVTLDGMRPNDGHEPDISAIASMEPLFSGFRTIQANKGVQRQTLLELAAEGQALREELDSMIALPHKSRADSVRIVRQYGKLESIVKSLKNNDNP